MKRERKIKPTNMLQQEFGSDFTNSEGYFSTTYVEWLEDKILRCEVAEMPTEEEIITEAFHSGFDAHERPIFIRGCEWFRNRMKGGEK